ncbi:DUF2993 domain-containing protein [Oscillatoria sp. CS-180]|uniref:LmeA family phospholipid-binding protein n=1 Tax=Oscillatoria sp. CS-180 TaxID=3021720 RepID=UPI00232E9B75|nr:DUF2993 domain-containing protein [Oscillatoria sp. CS-180]MDB9527346.1 DUF2993 domain-containing protein [Oscillatoria sp. CS-180]
MTSIVFGNLPVPGQSGDRVVSRAVTAAISALFKQTEKLEAVVRAEPVAKLFQGSVDGFDFLGQGLLMYSGLRVQSMEFYVQAVSIDFGAIFKGQVKLKQATQANMRIVLSEEDLNASFNTPFLIEKMQQFQFKGEPLHFEKTHLEIVGDRTLRLCSDVRVGQAAEPTTIDFTAKVEVKERRKIQFVQVTYGEESDNKELSEALVDHLNALLDLDKFALDGMQLRVDQLRLRNHQMTMYGVAKITDFPKRAAKAA